MHPATKSFSRFIGCDVGKSEIVAFDSGTGKPLTIANTKQGLAAFAAGLTPGVLVVCEATGGYELALLAALTAAGIAAHRADARKVKAFIRSYGTLGKTDLIDARALSNYGAERQAKLALWQAPDARRQRLAALVQTRLDMVADRVAYQNRLGAPGADLVRQHLRKVLNGLTAQIASIEAEIKTLIQADASLRRDTRALETVDGVGKVVSFELLALMPELGTLDRRAITCLGGLAPHPNQSSKKDGYRRVKGGRYMIKSILFMGALAASRSKGPLGEFYHRLLAKGKLKMVALLAVMRKMLTLANARLRDARLAA